ncbi:hypothetical protein FKM82_014201 [Ascaphus truei]
MVLFSCCKLPSCCADPFPWSSVLLFCHCHHPPSLSPAALLHRSQCVRSKQDNRNTSDGSELPVLRAAISCQKKRYLPTQIRTLISLPALYRQVCSFICVVLFVHTSFTLSYAFAL